jgi:hypothetical protein
MEDGLLALAEHRLHARLTTEEDAREALEWLAAREGKTLAKLIEELRTVAESEESE